MIRKAIKIPVFAISLVVVSPLILLSWLEGRFGRGEAVFASVAQLLAIVPGPIGQYLRAAFYFAALESCSWETHVGFGSVFTHRGSRVSRNFSTGAYCVIGHVVIGSGVRMASRVSVPSGKRQHLDDGGCLSDGTRYDRVAIGADSWIGEATIILANVGERTIVSAGAVVINEVPSNCIVGGNPAKVLKELEANQPVEGS